MFIDIIITANDSIVHQLNASVLSHYVVAVYVINVACYDGVNGQ